MAKYSKEEQLEVLGRIADNLMETLDPIMDRVTKGGIENFDMDDAINSLDGIRMLLVIVDIIEDISDDKNTSQALSYFNDPDIKIAIEMCQHILPVLKMIRDMEANDQD